jgi:hypothetical protein
VYNTKAFHTGESYSWWGRCCIYVKYVRYGFQNGEKIIRKKKKRSETKTRVVRVEMSRMILVKKTFSDFTVPVEVWPFDSDSYAPWRYIIYEFLDKWRTRVVLGEKKLQIFFNQHRKPKMSQCCLHRTATHWRLNTNYICIKYTYTCIKVFLDNFLLLCLSSSTPAPWPY